MTATKTIMTMTATLTVSARRPRPSQMNSGMRTWMRKPPVIRMAMPRKTRLVASVARNECTCSPVMIRPLTTPSVRPTKGAAASPTIGSRLTASHAAETVATPKIAPVERSKPPLMMTRVSAAAISASGVDWLRMLRRLRGIRKASLIRLI